MTDQQRQLRNYIAEEQAIIVEAAEALLRRLSPTVSSNKPIVMFEEFTQLRDALEYKSKAAAKLAEHLATLDAAEAALANCGLSGIYDDFSSPANAIKQMVERLVQLEGGQALQAERRLRQEAEQRAEKAKVANDHLRSAASQAPYLKDRAERAEVLARLVTEEMATLLERIGTVYYPVSVADKVAACTIAAEIREALDDSQA